MAQLIDTSVFMVGLWKSGQMIGAHDLQIASTALARGFEVATYDVRDFSRVPGLAVQRINGLPN